MDESIKIIYPVVHYPPVIGGLEQWMQNIAEHQPYNIEIIVVTGRVNGEPNFEKRKNVMIVRTSLLELRDLSYSSWFYILTAAPFIVFRSFIISQRRKVDLLHCHGFISAAMGYFLSIITRVPFIGTEQSLGWGSGKSKWLRRLIYQRARLCIAASTAVANEFGMIGMGNTKIIPNGVDLEKFRPPGEIFHKETDRGDEALPIRDEFFILCVGRLEKVKGHQYLIDAFSKIIKEIPRAKLILVGDGSERRNFEKQAEELGVKDSVRFAGEIRHDELPHYYHQADVFVMPSLSEGFGITAIEAMACGVAVIATRVGGLLDIIADGKGGILVEAGDSRAIARAVLFLSNNPQKTRLLKGQGIERAQEYSWDRVASRVTALYKNFI